MPSDAVSVVPDVSQTTLYALERNGLVDQIDITGGQGRRQVQGGGPGRTAQSIALSPDGSTLYVLKNAGGVSNIADVNTAHRGGPEGPAGAQSLRRGARLLRRRPALRTGGDG